MVKFLIKRPIAVIMSFIAIIVLGSIATFEIPVSLMPDIQIPEITVQVSDPNTSVREMENAIVKPLRRQLLQLNSLEDIRSEVKAGSGTVFLKFEYGTDTDISFIEVNEKIDLAMRKLPRDLERPKVIKANASDLPVFYLNILPKTNLDDKQFLAISELCEAVIKKRIEQLEEVAIADATGLANSELYITPNKSLMESIGISQNEIQSLLKENNISYGDILVRDGYYQYNIRFSSVLKTVEDVKNIYFKTSNKIFQLKDIATVGIRQQESAGIYLNNNSRAVNIAIIKKSDAQMSDLKDQIDSLINEVEKEYPEIEILVSQDQTSILNFTISNLKQSLFLGGILAFLLMFFFLKDLKSPFLIGFTIPTSIVISLLFFYIFDISINIISLSGLILGIGMMVDNSIIVIDNIIQHTENKKTVIRASIDGTNEVIKPLISSVLTTCAVFLPLIFLSGISGALFYDQAIAVTIGLIVSLTVSITLLPVLYKLLNHKIQPERRLGFFNKITFFNFEAVYSKGFNLVFKHKKYTMFIFILMILIAIGMFYMIEKEKLPQIEKKEMIVSIDWTTNITLEENKKRIQELLENLNDKIETSNAYVGQQQFLLDKEKDFGINESLIYIKAGSADDIVEIKDSVQLFLNKNYKNAIVSYNAFETIFDKLFSDRQSDIVVKITSISDLGIPGWQIVEDIQKRIRNKYPNFKIISIPLEDHLMIKVDAEKLVLYEISENGIFNQLKSAFNKLEIDLLKSSQRYTPIVISEDSKSIQETVSSMSITNKNNAKIPLSNLIYFDRVEDYKTLIADQSGLYVPISMELYNNLEIDKKTFFSDIKKIAKFHKNTEVRFEGKIFAGKKALREMVYVLIISMLFLYFILAAQFESLAQPFIVLLEVPLDIAGTLSILLIFGESLNLMSMIGIVVMSGIIINDSILKIATINQLRKEGKDLTVSLKLAGKKRLKPILMTSLTTILALVPFLFYTDLGSELQKPFALAVIGGMILGTLVSLYFIPLCYYYLYHRKNHVNL